MKSIIFFVALFTIGYAAPTGPELTASPLCIALITSTQRNINATLEAQINSGRQVNLPTDCFYQQAPETVCTDFSANSGDMFQIILWITRLVQNCDIPSIELTSKIAPRQSANFMGGNRPNGNGNGVFGLPAGGFSASAGVGGSTPNQNGGNYGGQMMVPAAQATPPNPFSAILNIIGSSVGPNGLTISPQTIAGILSLINQVVGLAVQMAPVAGQIAGPLLGAAMG